MKQEILLTFDSTVPYGDKFYLTDESLTSIAASAEGVPIILSRTSDHTIGEIESAVVIDDPASIGLPPDFNKYVKVTANVEDRWITENPITSYGIEIVEWTDDGNIKKISLAKLKDIIYND